MSPAAARKYFARLAALAASRAAIGRREAATEPDPRFKKAMEAACEQQEQQAAIYQARHDRVR